MTDPRTPVRAASDDPEYAANLRRATLASSIGSALEYFDFALYGLSTALIFNVLFFPQDDPAMATVAAFATFGVGFLARPFGGLFFGAEFDEVIAALADGSLDVRGIISHVLPVDDALDAFSRAADPASSCKVLIDFGREA